MYAQLSKSFNISIKQRSLSTSWCSNHCSICQQYKQDLKQSKAQYKILVAGPNKKKTKHIIIKPPVIQHGYCLHCNKPHLGGAKNLLAHIKICEKLKGVTDVNWDSVESNKKKDLSILDIHTGSEQTLLELLKMFSLQLLTKLTELCDHIVFLIDYIVILVV